MRSYLYTAFDIPSRFYPRYSRFFPEAQKQEEIDRYFLESLCALFHDRNFVAGPLSAGGRRLPYHLYRYAIQFFDFSFSEETRGQREPPTYVRPGEKKLLDVFGISKAEFDNLDEEGLTRLYRRKAQALHPDKGGDHEAFIVLKEAYESLLVKKGW